MPDFYGMYLAFFESMTTVELFAYCVIVNTVMVTTAIWLLKKTWRECKQLKQQRIENDLDY